MTRSKYPTVELGEHITELRVRNKDSMQIEVYSVTNKVGFQPAEETFKKQVFSKDTKNYKIVPLNAFAYNPSRINVGSIDYLKYQSEVLVSPLYIVFKTSEALHPKYLILYLKSELGLQEIRHQTQGAVRDSLKFSGLSRIKIPLPPLDEQKRIAEILDKADALRRHRQDSIDLTEQLIQSVFSNTFGDLADLPQKPLLKLLTYPLRNGLSPSTNGNFKQEVLTLSAITRGSFDKKAKKIGAFKTKPKSGAFINKNDFLICRGNGNIELCGRGEFPAASATNLVFPDTMIAARVDTNEVNESYFSIMWHSPYIRKQVELAARTAAGIFKINQTALSKISIPIPSEDRQRTFKNALLKIRDIQSESSLSTVHLENLFNSLQQRAFRGELDTSNVWLNKDVEALEQAADKLDEFVNKTLPRSFSKDPASLEFTPTKTKETKLQKLDAKLEAEEPIDWNLDYFKYRILGTQSKAFSFDDLIEQAQTTFEEVSLDAYEAVKEMIYGYLKPKRGKPVLRQRFNTEDPEASNYQKMVLEIAR